MYARYSFTGTKKLRWQRWITPRKLVASVYTEPYRIPDSVLSYTFLPILIPLSQKTKLISSIQEKEKQEQEQEDEGVG